MLPALSAKIERAKEQIQYLETEISAFFQTEPYSAVRNDDVESGEWFYALQIREQIPLRFSVIGGEITHDLRSCLDNLACHLIRANGGLVTSNSGFPVASAAKDYKSL